LGQVVLQHLAPIRPQQRIRIFSGWERHHQQIQLLGDGLGAESPNHFIAYARPVVNGEITHVLRGKGFLISQPGRWGEDESNNDGQDVGHAMALAGVGENLEPFMATAHQ